MPIYTLDTIIRPSLPTVEADNSEHVRTVRVRASSEVSARRAVIESALNSGYLVSGFTSVQKDKR